VTSAPVPERFAIYYVPGAATALWQLGCRWLGRDPEGGSVPPRPVLPGLTDADLAGLTVAARRYGFHATLKAPFVLAPGRDRTELERSIADYCRRRLRVQLPQLKVAALDGFLALVPSAPCDEADSLAADCVRHFDIFRAPPAPAELARRRAAGLTPRQVELLEVWGYPYVMEAFRLHLTLTDRLPADRRAALEPALTALFRDALAAPAAVDGLALFHEAAPGEAFNLVRRYYFGA